MLRRAHVQVDPENTWKSKSKSSERIPVSSASMIFSKPLKVMVVSRFSKTMGVSIHPKIVVSKLRGSLSQNARRINSPPLVKANSTINPFATSGRFSTMKNGRNSYLHGATPTPHKYGSTHTGNGSSLFSLASTTYTNFDNLVN